MLKNVWKIVTIATLLLMISGWAVAGNLEPPGGPAPTMKSLQEIYDKVAIGTEITSLPYTISSSGFYYITQDLTSPAGSHGITITADNVTLDLMGFSLIGPGGTGNYDGINMIARTNVEIRNGTIMYFPRHGIHDKSINEDIIYDKSNNGTGHQIIKITAVSNECGIMLSSRSNLVKMCTALSNSTYGIFVSRASTVTGNIVYDNGWGGIYAGYGSTVIGNTAYHQYEGHGISTGSGSTVAGNSAYLNDGYGIWAFSGSTVTGNTVYDNDWGGIYAHSGSTITSNTAFGNRGQGIYAGPGSTVIGNTSKDNEGWGINLIGYNLVDQNTAYSNSGGDMNSCESCEFGTNVPPQN